MAASIAIVSGNQATMIDVTPDVRQQYRLLMTEHQVLVSSIYLTHAHWGHYGGLPLFGKESLDTKGLPLFVTRGMSEYLSKNEPFTSLVRNQHFELSIVKAVAIDEVLKAGTMKAGRNISKMQKTVVAVPHRTSLTDTVAYVVDLNGRSVIYMPDIDALTDDLEDLVRRCDLAIIDGTFYSADEIRTRDISEVPHPLVSELSERLKDISERIIFTHLNHTNPLVDPDSRQNIALTEMGFEIAQDGDVLV
ncbi:MBL fold metallo-hydrolase [Calditrichota bacterium]